MGRKPKNKPSFFKIMFGDFTEKLRLPLAFLKHFTGRLPNEVILEISSGTCWIVKLEKVENSVFLGNGWQRFIDDNAIEFADLLVFKLFGKSKFYVRIYDKTCCEKESIVNGKCVDLKGKQGKQRTSPAKMSSSSESAIMKNREVTNLMKDKTLDLQLQTHGCKMKTRSANQGGQTAKPGESAIMKNREVTNLKKDKALDLQLQTRGCKMKTRSDSQGGQTAKPVKQRALLVEQVAKGYCNFIVPWRTKEVTPQQVKGAYEAAHQFKSDYPFFIVKLSKLARKYLNLPIGFVRSYLTDKSKGGEIIDVKGRTWLVNYTSLNFKRGYICGGWPAVSSENDLEEDHVCAFELVDKDNLKLKISVLYPKNKRTRLKPSITC